MLVNIKILFQPSWKFELQCKPGCDYTDMFLQFVCLPVSTFHCCEIHSTLPLSLIHFLVSYLNVQIMLLSSELTPCLLIHPSLLA